MCCNDTCTFSKFRHVYMLPGILRVNTLKHYLVQYRFLICVWTLLRDQQITQCVPEQEAIGVVVVVVVAAVALVVRKMFQVYFVIYCFRNQKDLYRLQATRLFSNFPNWSEWVIGVLSRSWQFCSLIVTGARFTKLNGLAYEQSGVCWWCVCVAPVLR